MNKRTVILCASFGTLVLSAAHVPASLGPSPTPSSSAQPHAQPTSSEHVSEAGPTPSEDLSFEQLRAAYAPDSPGASTSARASASAHTSRPAPTRVSSSLAPPLHVEEATLWLARAIYSETKLPHEQELVAWVVRNRVETGYRGNRTYRAVVLDPYQFSAFNPGSSKRSLLMGLQPETPLPRWQQALWVAHYVRHAAPVYRPFPVETRHFYSERSMEGRPVPYWADGSRFVPPEGRRYSVEERRFRFYKQIS